jgi:hypothetical protein
VLQPIDLHGIPSSDSSIETVCTVALQAYAMV